MNVDYYDELWRSHRPDIGGMADFWDRRAPSFNAHKADGESGRRRRQLVELLSAKAGLDAESRVLDIGCGSGHYSLLFAERAAEAVGFDISPRMIDFARANAGDAGVANAHFEVLDWDNVDLDERGWTGAFQLVLACKTPAVNGLAALEKMMAASRCCCCLINKVDIKNSIRDRLKPLMHWDEEKARAGCAFHCAFNILWLLGYYPEVWHVDQSWQNDLSLDDAVMLHTRYFESLGALSREQKEEVRVLLAADAVDGRVREEVSAKVIAMYWRV